MVLVPMKFWTSDPLVKIPTGAGVEPMGIDDASFQIMDFHDTDFQNTDIRYHGSQNDSFQDYTLQGVDNRALDYRLDLSTIQPESMQHQTLEPEATIFTNADFDTTAHEHGAQHDESLEFDNVPAPCGIPDEVMNQDDNRHTSAPESFRSTQIRRPQTQTTTGSRSSVDDWDDYRPFIEQLYVEENRKLTDVMEVMKVKFDFKPTIKMYKTQITRWRLKKNYKASEKEHLARIVKARRDTGRSVSQLKVFGRQAKLDRVRRFCKQEKIFEEICDGLPTALSSRFGRFSTFGDPPPNASTAKGTLLPLAPEGTAQSFSVSTDSSQKAQFDPERPLSSVNSNIGRIELVLLQTRTYYEGRVEILTRYSCGDLFYLICKGLRLLSRRSLALGWGLINKACGMVNAVLDEQPRSLLRHLFGTFKPRDWLRFPELILHLLRFFSKSSVLKFGCKHPISILLYHLSEQDIFEGATEAAHNVMIDISEQHKSSATTILKEDLCQLLIDRDDFLAAESRVLKFLRQSEELGDRDWSGTRLFLRRLGDLHRYQGRVELAESVYKDALRRGREFHDDEDSERISIRLLRHLADSCAQRGDFVQSKLHWHAALSATLRGYGAYHDRTFYSVFSYSVFSRVSQS